MQADVPLPGLHVLDASMVSPLNTHGAVRRWLTSKREWLERVGWRHTLVAPRARGPGRIDCGGLPLPGSSGLVFAWQRGHAARLIERTHPDLVEAADPFVLGWAALDAAHRLEVPAVAFCHGNLPMLFNRLAQHLGPAFGRWTEQRTIDYLAGLYRRFDLVLAPSLRMMRSLHAWGVPAAVQQPLGVDTDVFSPQLRDAAWRHALERCLELAPGARLLVYSGRFTPEKNLHVLVEAAKRLGPRYTLLVIGSGSRPPRGPGIRVIAPEADTRRLARLIANCDVLVHAGDRETFGLSALEAMASGIPVVTHSAGGLGELTQGVGVRVDTLDPDDWAQAIASCFDPAPPGREDAAMRRARSHDWDVVLNLLARRYRFAIAAKQRRGAYEACIDETAQRLSAR